MTGASPSAVAARHLSVTVLSVPGLVRATADEGPTHRRRFAGLWSVVGDAAAILLLVYIFPFVILAIGIPFALSARLLAWLVGVL
jgi:hypothetical protein